MERPFSELLGYIQSAGSISSAELARRTGLNGGLIEQALRDLARGGFLEPAGGADSACPPVCGECQVAGSCRPTAWRLTAKALRRVAG